jgi:hypothetical protein
LHAVDNLYNDGCHQAGSAVITPPADMTPGTMGRIIFRGPSFTNWDIEDVEAERADQARTSRRGV